VVFTRKGHAIYAIYLTKNEGDPFPGRIKFGGVRPKSASQVHLLGFKKPLIWRTEPSGETTIDLPQLVQKSPPCRHAIVVKFEMMEPQ